MKLRNFKHIWWAWAIVALAVASLAVAGFKEMQRGKTSYAPVAGTEDFKAVKARMSAAKDDVMKRHMKLLGERYDLSDRPAKGVTMSRGKPVQEGVRGQQFA